MIKMRPNIETENTNVMQLTCPITTYCALGWVQRSNLWAW